MTFAPPPYVPPATTTNPTSVMGRRISAALIDLLLPTLIACVIGAVVWFGNATEYNKLDPGVPDSCNAAEYNGFESQTGTDFSYRNRSSISCFDAGDSIWIASGDDARGALGVGFLIWLFVPLNAFLIQGLTGATVGKQILGLRVVRADGKLASFGWVALRSFLLMIAFVLNCLCFVGFIAEFITACATKRHQRVGDMAAGTFVVLKSSVGSPIDPFAGSMPAYGTSASQWAPPPLGGSAYGAPSSSPAPWGSTTAAPAAGSNIPAAWGVQAEPTATAAIPEASLSDAVVPEAAAPTAPPSADDPTQPRWDEARKAYIAWEPSRGSWMQHDTTTNEWRPI